jgi:hypothetical protein
MLYIKRTRLKTLLDGWVGGWVAGKAGLRIAYSNKKYQATQLTVCILLVSKSNEIIARFTDISVHQCDDK